MYIQLILGEKCNINCSYCHLGYKDQNTKLNKNIIINLKEKIKNYLSENTSQGIILEFQGGETLSYFIEIKYIVKEFKKEFGNKINFILTTNGTLINDNILLFLLQNKQSISLNISFDGTNSITTKNRTNNKNITELIIKNIQKIIKKGIKITIIGTINKEWINITNNDPIIILEYLNNTFNNIVKYDGQVKYFFRPEILLDKNVNYGIDINKIINFHKKLSKLINNEYYNIKEGLIEFNKELESKTICIDYNGTIYPNDYFKSYIKRYNKEILEDYEQIFNLFNTDNINTFNDFKKNIENIIIKKTNINISKELDKYFISSLLKHFYINVNYIKIKDNKKIKKIKDILEELISKNINNNYFIFDINKETANIYSKI